MDHGKPITTVSLFYDLERTKQELAGHKLVLQEYADRIDRLESIIRDLNRSLYSDK